MSDKYIIKLAGFVFGSIYLHQSFPKFVSKQHTHFDILTCQMWLQVMERHLILLRFLGIFIHFWRLFMSELLYLCQTFPDCVSNQFWYIKISDMTACYGIPLNIITFFLLYKIFLLYYVYTKFLNFWHNIEWDCLQFYNLWKTFRLNWN